MEGYRKKAAQSVGVLYENIIPVSIEIETITIDEIISEKKKRQHHDEVEKDNQGLYKKGEHLWIPDDAASLKLRITVEAHCGERGR